MIFQFAVDIPFGELDPQITVFLTPASTVPASDFTGSLGCLVQNVAINTNFLNHES